MRIPASALALVALATASPAAAQTPTKTRAATTTTTTTTLNRLTPTQTGAPVAGVTATGTPMTAVISWTAAANAVRYMVHRADGPNAMPALQTPNGIPPKACCRFSQAVPDGRITYTYTVVATYPDGTTGEGSTTFVSPPPTNPTPITARDLGNGSFTLTWPASAGATGYRVDGPPLPNTGQMVTAPTATIGNVPPGPQTWSVLAMYPGNVADYANGTKVNVVNRVAPPRGIPFLNKPAGPGDQATATFAMQQGIMSDMYPATANCLTTGKCSLGDLINGWGMGFSQGGGTDSPLQTPDVHFVNTTELGSPRKVKCFESPGKNGKIALICYATTPDRMSVIVQTDYATRFLVFPGEGYDVQATLTKAFDAEGPKFAPQSCMSCHGGQYDPKSGLVYGATLLPIDPSLVDFGGNRPRYEEAARIVNALIYRPGAGKPSAAVARYIEEMYGGNVLTPGAQAAATFVPSGWRSEQSFYLNIVKPNCQMCHLAVNPALNMTFESSANFLANKALIHNAVCKLRSMPHAEVPYRRFWTGGSGPVYVPGVFAGRLGYPACS